MANQIVPSSSFNSTPSWTYDVFLSFRGEDTRTNFTDHLYHALDRHGINTFIDHRELPTGEEISPTLLEAIDKSRISVIVFSENYASSRWCLDELVHILECRKSKGQMTRPIFYKVDPSDVRHQTSSYGAAFADHGRKYENDLEKVQRWRIALTEAANLKGATLNEGEYETTFIDHIVEEISIQISNCTCLNVARYPIGIESCAKEVEEVLGVGGNDRRVVGIWGTSGIGKTTIAKAVYNAIAHKFEGSCFLADVRETLTLCEGVIQLQNTLLSKILRGRELKIVNAYQGISLIKKRLSQKKILFILDDVDELEQLKDWVDVDCFGEGSRVIITTKNRSLLDFYGGQWIYEVQKLEDDKALELFSLNAFERNKPPDDYLSLARRATAYAQGLPLALNLIGSYLRKKSIGRWQAVLDSYDSYEREPYRSIQRVLRKSYDSWDSILQQVFLDIACFFKGRDKDYVLQVLRSSKLNVPQDYIEVLVENAIIAIENNRILMHDLLQKLGKHIVYEESPTEPGERSRLWHHEDVCSVLTENRGTKKIRGIVVELPKSDVIPLNPESFLLMVNLEIFINRNASFSGRVDYLPNSLRWIELGGRSNIYIKHTVVFNLPCNYNPRHLVMFDLSCSGIRQLKEFKNLAKLTWMNLSGCEFLEKIPDLSGCPNIKSLNLFGCKNLVEVDDSVGFLDKLVILELYGCSKLTRFATRLGLRSLKFLWLPGCTRLESFPEIDKDKMESLEELHIQRTGIRELPSSIAYLTGLQALYCEECNLSESDFLVPLDCWDTLKVLYLSRNNFVSLPDCISKFVNLEKLFLNGCKRLREIPQVLPPKLQRLNLDGCTSLEKIPKLPPMLQILNLSNCCRLSGDEVAKLENNLLNAQESLWHSQLEVTYPGNEVPKWFNYTSNHPKIILEGQYECIVNFDSEEEYDRGEGFVGGSEFYTSIHPTTVELPPSEEEVVQESEFSFEIPLNLQVGKTLLGLALSFVSGPPDFFFCILINGIPQGNPRMLDTNDSEATHVWLRFLYLPKLKQQGNICQVTFRFPKSANIKSCGVHLLLRNQNKRLPLTLRPTRSLGKRRRRRNMIGNNNGIPYLWSQRMIVGNVGRLTSTFLLTLRRRRRSKGNRPLHMR